MGRALLTWQVTTSGEPFKRAAVTHFAHSHHVDKCDLNAFTSVHSGYNRAMLLQRARPAALACTEQSVRTFTQKALISIGV